MGERVELDQLVYTMSADISRLSKDTRAAIDMIRKSANDNQAAFEQAGKKAGSALGQGIINETGRAIALNRVQMMEFSHIARSAFDSLAAGASPTRVLAQEGARLAQAFGSGTGGVAGTFSALGAFVNPVTIGVTALVAVMASLVIAEHSYESEHSKLLLTLLGTASVSNLTVKSLNDIVIAAEKANGATYEVNQTAAETFATIGKVTAANMPASLALLKNYAAIMGQDIPHATDDLAKALADPAQGAANLTDKLHFLNAEQLMTIDRLQIMGDRAGAQKVILDALGPAIDGASSHLSGLGLALQSVANAFKDAWHWAGEFAYNATHIDDHAELTRLLAARADFQQMLIKAQAISKNTGGVLNDNNEVAIYKTKIANLDKVIAEKQKAINDRAADAQNGINNQASVDRMNRRDAADPAAKLLRDDRALLAGLMTDLKAATSAVEKASIQQSIGVLQKKITAEGYKATGTSPPRKVKVKAAPQADPYAVSKYNSDEGSLSAPSGVPTWNMPVSNWRLGRSQNDGVKPIDDMRVILPEVTDQWNAVNDAMKAADEQGMQTLIDGLAQVAVRGGKASDVLHNVLQQLEIDLAKIALQQGASSAMSAGKTILSALATSFDGGGYTGSGARTGGVDGKGGFMAIMHPNETVIDHTKTMRSATSSPAMRSSIGGAVSLQLHSTYQIVGTGVNPDVTAAIAQSHQQAVTTALTGAKEQMAGWSSTDAWGRG